MTYGSVWGVFLLITILGFVLTGPIGFGIATVAFFVAVILSVLISNKRWDVPAKQRPRTFIPNAHHDIKHPKPAPEITFMPPNTLPPDIGQSEAEYDVAVAQVLAQKYRRKKDERE